MLTPFFNDDVISSLRKQPPTVHHALTSNRSRLYRTALVVVQKQLAESRLRRQGEQKRQQDEYRRLQEETERAEHARRERRLEELSAQLDTVEQNAEVHSVVEPAGDVELSARAVDDVCPDGE